MEAVQYQEMMEVQENNWWFQGKRRIVDDFLERYAIRGGNLLDVGCGMGLTFSDLRNYGEGYGIDMEKAAVEYCQSRFPDNLRDHIRLGSLPDGIPFDDRMFDTIVALDVLEHIEDDMKALNRICDLLGDGGVFIGTVPAHMYLWGYNDVLNHHFRRYEKDELLKKLKRTGFKIKKLSFYNTYLYSFAYITRKFENVLHIKKSDISVIPYGPGGIINKILYKIFASERYHLRKGSFCNGVSLIFVAVKER